MMKQFGAKLVGKDFSFEHRIFNFLLLLGILMTSFGTAMNLYYRVSIVVDLVFIGYWVLMYYLSRVRGYYKAVSVAATGVFVFVFFPYNWSVSSGIIGSLPYYAIFFIAVISIVLSGRFRIMMVFSMLGVELLLIMIDAQRSADHNIPWFDPAIHLGVIMISMAVLIIVYSNTYMKEKERGEEYVGLIEEHYQQQAYYLENLEQLIYKLKAERHDFNHHLGVIYGLLEGGEFSQARDYAGKLVNAAEEYQNIVHIPYSILRAMLNYKLSSAKEAEVFLKLNISLPEGLQLNEFDLTAILGNLLDNAMEACTVLEAKERYINLSISHQLDYLVIRIENPVNEGSRLPVDGSGTRTTKKDVTNHGFGLKNLEYLVKKHHGLSKIQRDNGVFRVNIALLTKKV